MTGGATTGEDYRGRLLRHRSFSQHIGTASFYAIASVQKSAPAIELQLNSEGVISYSAHIHHGRRRKPQPTPPNLSPRSAGFTERVPRGLALLASVALSGVPSRPLSRTLPVLSAVLRSIILRGALCLGTLTRRCLTLSTLSRITLSLGTTQTILRMQRLQTSR